MLFVFQHITFWVSELGDKSGLNIICIDGSLVYEGNITQANRPISRDMNESTSFWLKSILEALSNIAVKAKEAITTELQLKSHDDSHLQWNLFKLIKDSTSKSLLVNFKCIEVQEKRGGILNATFSSIAEHLHAKSLHLQAALESNSKLESQNQLLIADIKSYLISKDRIQTDMLQKACMLINVKKREIRELRRKLDSTEKTSVSAEILPVEAIKSSSVSSTAKVAVAKQNIKRVKIKKESGSSTKLSLQPNQAMSYMSQVLAPHGVELDDSDLDDDHFTSSSSRGKQSYKDESEKAFDSSINNLPLSLSSSSTATVGGATVGGATVGGATVNVVEVPGVGGAVLPRKKKRRGAFGGNSSDEEENSRPESKDIDDYSFLM